MLLYPIRYKVIKTFTSNKIIQTFLFSNSSYGTYSKNIILFMMYHIMWNKRMFKRYELKYLLTERQKKCVMEAMEPCMAPDAYGRTTIRNIYFDTADYRLARRSIEKPVYKEKLRIRSYEKASGASPVFVELKKKYKLQMKLLVEIFILVQENPIPSELLQIL